MAGRPLQRACFRALDEREEDIFDRLAGGEFVTNLCAEFLAGPYSEAGKDSPNAYHFYAWLDAREGRRARFERVREAAADAVAEESIRILDEAREQGVSSTAEATLVRAQSNSRQWWASKLNRERYGEGKSGVEVRMSIQEMHLEALQAAGSMRRRQIQDAEPVDLIAGECGVSG